MKQVLNIADRSEFYASDELLSELKEKIKPNDCIVNFAYTDYGGDFFDKVCIAFFTEKHPDNIVSEDTIHYGKNAFIFGQVAKDFLAASESYPLGYAGIEEYYSEKESEAEYEGFKYFIDNINTDKYVVVENSVELLCDKYGGYFSITTQGLDYSERDLITRCIQEGILTEIPEQN